MNMHFEFDNPTKILFGSGSLNQLGDQAMPGAKAAIWTGRSRSLKERACRPRYGTGLWKIR